MPVSDMTIKDALNGTWELFGAGTPGVWFRDHFVAAAYRDELRALREILEQAPPAGSEAERLIEELELEDAEHDREVRFGKGYLELLSQQHWDPRIRADCDELVALL